MDRIEKEVSAGDVGMTRVLISGWFGRDNLGDEAILESEIESIRSTIPGAEITVISQNPFRVREIHGVESIAFHHSPRRPLGYISKVKELLSSDVFLLGGGGFLSDWQSPNVPEIWLRTPLQAKRLGSKTMAFGIGAGPISTSVGKKWTKKALDRFDAITVRDQTSRQVLENAGVSKSIEVTADPAVILPPPGRAVVSNILSKEGIPLREDIIGLAPAPIFQSETLWPGCREKYARYRKTLVNLIEYVDRDIGMNVLLIPMDREVDLPFLEGLRSECESPDCVHLVKGTYRPREIRGLIGHLKLLIGGRFHSVLFGVMSKVPTIGISSHHKIRDFLVDVGLGPYSHPLGDGTLMENVDLDISRLGTCVGELLTTSAKVRRKLEEGAKELEKRARRNNEILGGLISGD